MAGMRWKAAGEVARAEVVRRGAGAALLGVLSMATGGRFARLGRRQQRVSPEDAVARGGEPSVRGGSTGASASAEEDGWPAEAAGGISRAEWAKARRIIRADVVRTDTDLPYYRPEGGDSELPGLVSASAVAAAGGGRAAYQVVRPSPPQSQSPSTPGPEAENVNVRRLRHVLEAYVLRDPEVGYCQGMSDILSPFVVYFGAPASGAGAFPGAWRPVGVADAELLDAWCLACFGAFMQEARALRENFLPEPGNGIGRQLDALRDIVATVDPGVAGTLERAGLDGYFFCYRAVLVLFRRELALEQCVGLWELLWAEDAVTRDMHLFILAALVLEHARPSKGASPLGMDDLVRRFNDLAGTLDVGTLVAKARKVAKKYRKKRGTDLRPWWKEEG